MRYLQWHPAFYASLKVGFAGEKVELEREHNLSSKPMQIDVVAKKAGQEDIKLNIGQMFRKYNIIEYKSPDDYLSIDDYYKVFAYAYFYKAEAQRENEIPESELTITFVCKKYPRKLIWYLRYIKKYEVVKQDAGIFYIYGGEIPIQIVVTSKLSEKKNFWLKYLTNDLKDRQTVDKIVAEYKKHQNEELYQSMMDVIVNANRELFEEVWYMCDALRELFREDLERELAKELKGFREEKERAMEEGRVEGRAEGRAEGRVEGRVEGRTESILDAVRNIMHNLSFSLEQAMDALSIPQEERAGYVQLL